ncbi:MAG: hypothetical protein EZS28_000887 [Streblomastix strix]|uniref:CSC1/OSCA1-like cytosolic domain-containing protein n=1 Tax=Streblomastix strix TaxID=222440 RepID=A0A5J4XAQ6_9EUKA|nr:MAG: hypothetical protein EZS28_000887 [Streblomastix strix]
MSSASEKIKRAKLAAITYRLVKLGGTIEDLPNRQIPLSESIEKTGAGQGTSCYFAMMKTMAIIFSIGTLASIALCVIFSLFAAYNGNLTDGFILISLGNMVAGYWTNNIKLALFNWLLFPELVFAILVYSGLKIMKIYVKKAAERADNTSLSCGDYGIMVEGIPKDEKSSKLIFQHFNKLAPVHSVLLLYDCRQHATIQKAIDDNVENYYKALRADNFNLVNIIHFSLFNLTANERVLDFKECQGEVKDSCFGSLMRKIGMKNDLYTYRDNIIKLMDKRAKLDNPGNEENTTGIAFVIFNKANDAHMIAERYNKESNISIAGSIKIQPYDLQLDGQYPLRVTPSIEPNDVHYQNLGYSYAQRFVRKHVVADGFALILVVIGVIVPYFLNQFKTQTNNFWLSLVLSLIVTGISSTISISVTMFTPFTKPASKTEAVSSSILRIWVADFAMGALATYIYSMIDNQKVEFTEDNPETMTSYFMSYKWFSDVAINLLFIIFIDVVKVIALQLTQIVTRLLNHLPAYLFAKSKTQDELNKAFYPPTWSLEIRLAHLTKIVFSDGIKHQLSILEISSIQQLVIQRHPCYNAPEEHKTSEDDNKNSEITSRKGEITGIMSYGCIQDFDFGFQAELGNDGVYYSAYNAETLPTSYSTQQDSGVVSYSASVDQQPSYNGGTLFWDKYYGNFNTPTTYAASSSSSSMGAIPEQGVVYDADPASARGPNKASNKPEHKYGKQQQQSYEMQPTVAVAPSSSQNIVQPRAAQGQPSQSKNRAQDQHVYYTASPEPQQDPSVVSYSTELLDSQPVAYAASIDSDTNRKNRQPHAYQATPGYQAPQQQGYQAPQQQGYQAPQQQGYGTGIGRGGNIQGRQSPGTGYPISPTGQSPYAQRQNQQNLPPYAQSGAQQGYVSPNYGQNRPY